MWAAPSRSTEELGMEEHEGGSRKWEARAVRFLFSTRHSHPLHPCCQRHHLPRVQMRTGGGFFLFGFDASTTTATSLASKCESEVVFLSVSTHLPQPPPPSHPNASRGWFFYRFRRIYHDYHLPRIQTRVGGGFNASATSTDFFDVSAPLPPPPPPSRPSASWRWIFSTFRRLCHHHLLPPIPSRAGGGSFVCFDAPTTTTTLASKREPEVVLSSVSTDPPPPPPPSCPNASWRWFFRWFRRPHHHHLPRVQTRAGGGIFGCFDMTATNSGEYNPTTAI